MQHDSCKDIQLLISRLIDDEVSAAERARVEQHVAVCDACAVKMLEYMEMAVLFSETPLRQPEPNLRSSLFREIGNLKEEEKLKEDAARKAKERPWFLPPQDHRDNRARGTASTFLGRLMQAASPFAVAATALFVFLGALLLGNRLFPDTGDGQTPIDIQAPVSLATRPAPIDISSNGSNAFSVPGAVETKVETVVELASASPSAPRNNYVNATMTLGSDAIVQLAQPTPVLEDGNAGDTASWHVMQDPQYGYKISYPPNLWTQVADGTRYFYPWTAGGTANAPYWVEMIVSPNPHHYTPENANEPLCNGNCDIVKSKNGQAIWLRQKQVSSDGTDAFDQAYMFDTSYVYKFRVVVPVGPADFQNRMAQAQGVFGGMSGKVLLADNPNIQNSSFGGELFLNGTDLWLVSGIARGFRVTSGYKVRQFAESPDMSTVAFAGDLELESNSADTNNASGLWAHSVYLTRISENGPAVPVELLSNMDIHDIAWYSDRELLVLAQSAQSVLALYRIVLPETRSSSASGGQPQIELLLALPGYMSGAGSLAVSPDRQLITFLAPLGEQQGTDIYAVRPDGSDLRKIVSHTDPVSTVGGNLELGPESQAIKSYVWTAGELATGGYEADILFTCGNSYGPYSFRGGLLFSTNSSSRNPLLDPIRLVSDQPERMQIIHIAYSDEGEVAFTGYVNDSGGRADQLVGLWTANFNDGRLLNPQRQPLPQAPDGVTDLSWSPDGTSLIYRETIPVSDMVVSSSYDGGADFRIMSLDVSSGKSATLFDATRR